MQRAEIIETAQMDILEKQTENNGSLSERELYEILTSENYHTQGTIEGNPRESILNATLISKDEKYAIPVSEIYNGNFSEEEPVSPSGPVGPIGPIGPSASEVSISGSNSSISFTPKNNQTWFEWATDTEDNNDLNIGEYSSDSELMLKALIINIHNNSAKTYKGIRCTKSTESGYSVVSELTNRFNGKSVKTTDAIQAGSYYFKSIM